MERQAFLENLSQSGLLSKEQIAEVSAQFGSAPVAHLASSLVDDGRLTPFQVRQLMAGKSKGLVLGQYRILEELGRGGYGCVYKARHNLMERVVALKVITPDLVQEPRARAWFRREVLAATQLNHPNIALAYDADEVDDILFFAMEFIDGPNLDTLVREQGPLPIGMAAEMMQQAAKALQYAHEKGMVHRDIKPANLLIPLPTPFGRGEARPFHAGPAPVMLKVVDFGLARLQTSSPHNTLVLQNEKSFVGTPAYVAPEQARNVHDADIRSDLYSLGCTFYYALSGRPPFKADTVVGTIAAHLEKEADRLEKYRPEVPPALASIVRRLMAKKPEKRFQSPAELLSELSFFFGLGGSVPNLVLPPSPVEAELESSPEPSLHGPLMRGSPGARDAVAEKDLATTRVVPEIVAPTQNKAGLAKKISSGTLLRPSLAFAPKPPLEEKPAVATLERAALAGATATFHPEAAAPANPQGQDVAPPTTPAPSDEHLDEALAAAWRRWTGVVECLSTDRSLSLGEAGYASLQRELLDACRAQIAHANPARQALAQQIAELVQPWLTLQTLATTDRETAGSLSLRCRQIDAALGIARSNPWPSIVALLILATAGVLGWLIFQDPGRFRVADLPGLSSAWLFFGKHPVLSLAVLVPVVISAALFLLKRLLRS